MTIAVFTVSVPPSETQVFAGTFERHQTTMKKQYQ